jgi:hypothetical protein
MIVIIFLLFTFAITSFAQKGLDSIITIEVEKCKSQVTSDSITFFASIESLLAPLEKKLPPLEQEFFGKCFSVRTEYCLLLEKEYLKKREICKNNYKFYRRGCYSSQDVEIKAEIMIGSLCNKLKEFTISYKKNGIGYDSTIYPNTGDWKVTERSAKATITRHSGGERNEYFYDNQGRITSHFYIRANKDTMTSDRYFWEKGRLVKTVFDGVERTFIYGKTLLDTVRVTPIDIGTYFHPGYDNSVGKIPNENDPEYKDFTRSPYNYYARPELLERQKARCEEYKEKQKKKGNKK